MKSMERCSLIAAALFLLHAAPAVAQERWAAEVRAGVAFPTSDIGEEELDVGVGFEGTVRYRFLPHLAAYAGWDWFGFATEAEAEGAELDVEETGYALGLRFEHPFSGEAGSGPAYWLRAGATIDHIEVEDDEGEIVADSDHGLGWEAGGGLTVPIGESVLLTPGVRYRSLSRDLDVGDGEIPVDLRYLAADVGVVWRF